MPKIEFQGRTFEVQEGVRLRSALHEAGLSPHNGASRGLNCRGFGTCGTCAVQVEGAVSPMGTRERMRLGFPPHSRASGLRLACQARVLGDVKVVKHPGFWGQLVPEPETSTTNPI